MLYPISCNRDACYNAVRLYSYIEYVRTQYDEYISIVYAASLSHVTYNPLHHLLIALVVSARSNAFVYYALVAPRTPDHVIPRNR